MSSPRIYRWVWTVLWTAFAAVGGSLNVSAHGWAVTFSLAGVLAAVGAGWHYNRPGQAHRRVTEVLEIMGVGAVAAISVSGWVTFLGPSALALPVAAALSWPGAAGYLVSRALVKAGHLGPSRAEPTPQAPAAAPVSVSADTPQSTPIPAPLAELSTQVTTLTDEQLCRAWRASFKTLEQLLVTADTAQQAQFVSRRQQYLDELEHRHPQGFRRWLDSGARPAGDPSRFIAPEAPRA